MFNENFYPTPYEVIEKMIGMIDLTGKIVLEPSAGKGDIVDYLKDVARVKEVIACEKEYNLRMIVANKCNVIKDDFLNLESHEISHIDAIVMNPPFSADDKHILHAWDIAPEGCEIVSLCNRNTVRNTFSETRQRLELIIKQHGTSEEIGQVFTNAERTTGVDTTLIRLRKPGKNENTEFHGFFMEEEEETQSYGIMSYNFIRDLVNRYVESVKIFDKQMELGVELNEMSGQFYKSEFGFYCKSEDKLVTRNSFKKSLQKSAWEFVINKMNMYKYTTKKLKEDINKFVESQTHVPFTMANVYRMLEIIIGTNGARMEKALEEVFDKLTQHYHDNRFSVEGWKTNSNYVINEKFIMPWLTEKGYDGQMKLGHGRNEELIEDLFKALCWLTGEPYNPSGGEKDYIYSFRNHLMFPYRVLAKDGRIIKMESSKRVLDRSIEHMKLMKTWKDDYIVQEEPYYFGKWYEFRFFEFKGFKKGTMHFKFKDKEVWRLFNMRIAKIKGFPLYEKKGKYYEDKELARI